MSPSSDDPPSSSLQAIARWAEKVHSAGDPREVWVPLDTDLRTTIAQSFLLGMNEQPDDARAAALAARDSADPWFPDMLQRCARHWRRFYAFLAAGMPTASRSQPVGADMELTVVPTLAHSGAPDRGPAATSQAFITRLTHDRGWVIAALSHKLPVPGWPPTEWTIPHLRKRRP
jgi:hypothetical protein